MPNLIRPEGPEAEDFRFSRRALATGALGGLAFAGYAPAALARQAAPIITDDDGLTVEQTTIPAPDGFALPIFAVRPTGDGPWPVVVVASEIFGVHEYIRDLCRRLAKAGYAAVAPSFFNRVEDPAGLSYMSRVQQIVGAANYEQVMGDVSATLDWVSQQLWANSDKVGITGFCWGGKVVWQACASFAVLDAGVDRVSLADTVGYADPAMVQELFALALPVAGDKLNCGHFHDTRGLGLANVYAALQMGITRFDACLGGIGGCPHAPGASGNVATEDLAYMLASMGISTGLDFDKLIALRKKLVGWLSSETLHGTLWRAGLPKTMKAADVAAVASFSSVAKG